MPLRVDGPGASIAGVGLPSLANSLPYSASVWGTPGERHASPRMPRPVFSNPGDGRWRTDVALFVLAPFLLACMLGVSVLAALEGGPGRLTGFAFVGAAAAILLPAGWLRWRMLDARRARRPIMLYYALVGVAVSAGIMVALGG